LYSTFPYLSSSYVSLFGYKFILTHPISNTRPETLDLLPNTVNLFQVGDLLKDLDGSSGEPRRQLALLTVGEVGQHKDLSGISALNGLVLASFDSADEAVRCCYPANVFVYFSTCSAYLLAC
jgi:hypothetical protein